MNFKRFITTILVMVLVYFTSNACLDKLQDEKNVSEFGKEAASENKEQKVDNEILMLLVGVDANSEGDNNFTRTDTIMLCKINAETGNIDLLSIPRDSRIKIRDEFTKANHAHAYGGIELTLQSLRKFLGLDIDFYTEVNYEALVEIVDAMGGVDYDIPEGVVIDHGDVHLRAGQTHMNGMDVLWYLRTRKIYNNGDLGRVSAQQEFLKDIVNEIVKKSKTMNFTAFIESYFKYVKTNLPLKTMIEFASSIENFSSDKFKTYTVPGVAYDIDEISYYIPDYEKTWDIVDEVFSKYKLDNWERSDSGYEEYFDFDYNYANPISDELSYDLENDYQNDKNSSNLKEDNNEDFTIDNDENSKEDEVLEENQEQKDAN